VTLEIRGLILKGENRDTQTRPVTESISLS